MSEILFYVSVFLSMYEKTVLGFSVSEFRVHDLGAPNFPQTWEEEGYTCMEDLKTSSEEKRQNTKLLLKKYIEPRKMASLEQKEMMAIRVGCAELPIESTSTRKNSDE